MPITKYPNTPHFDDFDETKNFYRILFRGSRPVQPREMNQLQTIINNQIDKLASHLFTDGSPVVGGNVAFNTEYNFVKLESSFTHQSNSLNADDYASEFLDTVITGQTSGVKARVLQVVEAVDNDPLTLYVRYEDSGTGGASKTFAPSEIIESDAGIQRFAQVKPLNDTPTGFGANFSVDEGYFYVNGALVYAPFNSIIIGKYSPDNINTRLSYKITEEVITSDTDTSLKDNSLGSGSAGGTGADRQKISLTLIQEDIDQTNRNATNNKLIQLLVIRNSIVSNPARTEYSELGDTLAQRTYDESGNYTVNNFGINIKEHLNDGTNLGQYTVAEGGDANKLAIGVERGKAYVFGYPIEVEDTIYLDVDKARDTAFQNSVSITMNYGNYIEINNLASLPDIQSLGVIVLRNSSNVAIGTTRARYIQYISGSGSSAIYRLYIFDTKLNSGQSFSSVDNLQQTVSYGGSQFTADVISGSSIFNSNSNSLLFDLPFSTVQTLRDQLNNIETVYDTSVLLTGTVVSGSLTLNSNNSDITFNSSSVSNYVITRGDNGAIIVPDSIAVNNPASTVTLNFTGQDGNVLYVYAPVTKVNATSKEKTKTLVTGATVNILTPDVTSSGIFYSLGKSDILKINSIVSDGKNITNQFILDNGQRDNFYTTGRVQLKTGFPQVTGTTIVNFDYFTHGAGDYFSVDSYSNIDYEDIPSYGDRSLRDVLDFRPIKDETGVDFTSTGSSRGVVVEPNSVFRTDIQYYLPRIDKVYVNKDGDFGIIKGISSIPPQIPNNPKDSMVLYALNLNPYTFGDSDLIPSLIDNSRSTMEDIRNLKKRVDKLEYYTSLSLLEKETANQQILDDSGLERFKNGFVANSFYGHNLSYVTHPDYKCSIDKVLGHLRPMFYQDNVKLSYNIGLSSNVQKTGTMITLPYTNVIEERQPFATQSVNVNPFNVFRWSGNMTLSPATDEWKETNRRPDVIFNNEGFYDSLINIIDETDANGTLWNEWTTNWQGVETNRQRIFDAGSAHGLQFANNSARENDIVQFTRGIGGNLLLRNQITTTTTSSQTRTGIERRIINETLTNNLGDRVVEINFVPFIRSRKVYFKAERLKPNTRVYPFFDGINISNFTRQESFVEYSDINNETVTNYLNATVHPDGATNLITNASGAIEGSFIIPNTPTIRFKTGSRTFKLTDSATNTRSEETTTSEVIYEANGIVETKENLVISTEVPRIERSIVRENRVVRDVRVEETTEWIDPIAQSFLLDRNGGVFLTSIDLYFKQTDPNIPVTLQIRTMENGVPTSRVVPFSEVTLNPSQVNTSANASVSTKFQFRSLVYLQQSVEYCFVVLSNSDKYLMYIAELGGNDLTNTDVRVDKQPYAGVLFKSKNASTWTAEQTQTVKFILNRAEFTQSSGSVVLNNVQMPLTQLDTDPLEFTSGSNVVRVYHKNHGMFEGSRVRISGVEATSGSVINNIPLTEINKVAASNNTTPQTSNTHIISDVEFDTYKITVSTNANASGRSGGANIFVSKNNLANVVSPIVNEIILPNTDIFYNLRLSTGQSLAGNETPYTLSNTFEVIPNENVKLKTPHCVASHENETLSSLSGNKSAVLTATLSSNLSNISPVIDLERVSLITICNRIDKPNASDVSGFNQVENFVPDTAGIGGSSLAQHIDRKFTIKEDADTLKVLMAAHRPSGSDIDFYYKVSSDNDSSFDEADWTLATPDEPIVFSDRENNFNEIIYTIDAGENFTVFSGKIVMRSSNSSNVPIIKDYRIIAAT